MDYKRNTNPFDFVGKLISSFMRSSHTVQTDTGLSEMLVPMTRTEQFGKTLEIQQSMCVLKISFICGRFLIAPSRSPRFIRCTWSGCSHRRSCSARGRYADHPKVVVSRQYHGRWDQSQIPRKPQTRSPPG